MEAPVTPVPDGTITSPHGFAAGATAAGIREDSPDRLDLALLVADRPCAAAAVYTTNIFQAPPLRRTQRSLADGAARAVIVNAGCANSLTGERGERDAEEMAKLTARKLGISAEEVAVASTGVTGWLLPMDRIRAGIERIMPTDDGGGAFAEGILTTDTVAKQAAARFEWDGQTYTVGGAAKGSGMIDVNMATMLAFLTTDAPVHAGVLQPLLRETVDETFNMLTIDNATSTNDMALALASGAAGGETFARESPALSLLRGAFVRVATTLTRELARDGEGATKLLEARVEGAATVEDARKAAKAIAGSMLLKAAIFGNDANWGRVLDAVGYSGAAAREEHLRLSLQDVRVYMDGEPRPFDEAALSKALDRGEVSVTVDLGVGNEQATAWGCDLTPEYVRINSEYTT